MKEDELKCEHDPSGSTSSEDNAPKNKEHSSTLQASHLAQISANMYRNMMLQVDIRTFFEQALANQL